MNIKFLIGIAILLLATWSFHSPAPMAESGIEGQVLMGTSQPYQATLTVKNPNGGMVVQFQTDAGGHFRLPLAPGEYILHPEAATGTSSAVDQLFVVGPDHYTQLIVTYNSGLR
jgi:hypothetical protein